MTHDTAHAPGAAITLGGMKENGATDTLIAENYMVGNGNSWGCNGALSTPSLWRFETIPISDDLRRYRTEPPGVLDRRGAGRQSRADE